MLKVWPIPFLWWRGPLGWPGRRLPLGKLEVLQPTMVKPETKNRKPLQCSDDSFMSFVGYNSACANYDPWLTMNADIYIFKQLLGWALIASNWGHMKPWNDDIQPTEAKPQFPIWNFLESWIFKLHLPTIHKLYKRSIPVDFGELTDGRLEQPFVYIYMTMQRLLGWQGHFGNQWHGLVLWNLGGEWKPLLFWRHTRTSAHPHTQTSHIN